MPNVSFVGVLIVALVAFLAPLLLGLSPARRLPSVVIEIVAGIMIGPSVLGWVSIDLPISILSVIGLAFLLFLAGMEVELERLRGRLLLYVGLAFVASMGLAFLVGSALFAAGQVRAPLFIAIILVATALGVVVPLLQDVGESATDFGQLVIAGAMFAEFGSIILLSLFFSREATGAATKVVLLISFALLAERPLPSWCSAWDAPRVLRRYSCDSRTRPRRFACVEPSSCWWPSSRWRRCSGSKRSSAHL